MCDIIKEIKKIQLENTIGMRELRKSQEEAQRDTKELKKVQKQMQKELGGLGNSQEEVGIDLFRRNMKPILRKKGIYVDKISTRFKAGTKLENGEFLQGEYDLMLINGKDIVVVEVKNKLKSGDIKKFLKKQLPKFKLLFPQYKNYNLYGGVGGLIVKEDEEKLAEKNGLFVFTQGKDGNATLANKPDFKAKIF